MNSDSIQKNATNNSNIEQDDDESSDVDGDENSIGKTSMQTTGQYCYVGKNKGYRSCVELAEGDKCMSGDIFSFA